MIESKSINNSLHDNAKIYFDTGNGFFEYANQNITLNEKSNFIVYPFEQLNKKIRRIQFKPVSCPAVIRIENISISFQENVFEEIIGYHTNAYMESQNIYYFINSSPSIFINTFDENIYGIRFKICILNYGDDVFQKSIGNFSNQIDARFEAEIEQITKKVDQITNKIKKINDHFELKHNELYELIERVSKTVQFYEKRFYEISIGIAKNAIFKWFFKFTNSYKIIRQSKLFDDKYYIQHYDDVRICKIDPLVHYLKVGFKEGRDPNRLFKTSFYLDQYPDVKQSGTNPLVHYLETGALEGLKPNPLFDTAYYLDQYPDVAKSGKNPLVHYLEVGAREGRKPNPLFDTTYYLDKYPDVHAHRINPLIHYLTTGAKEGRNPHPDFNTNYYLSCYGESLNAKENPLAHYLAYGSRLGYCTHPKINSLVKKPKISIIVPIYKIDEKILEKTIRSVQYQTYNRWELCLIDDGSMDPNIRKVLKKKEKEDNRIRYQIFENNIGIANSSNEGVKISTGEYLAFLDHDDRLTENALLEIVLEINKKDSDIIYTDEEVIDNDGNHIDFIFKPDFSPDLLFSYNYITHLLAVKRSIFDSVGGFLTKYDGAQDYDLILRLSEHTCKISRISKNLYQWRQSANSTAEDPYLKYYAVEAGKKSLQSAVQRRKIDGVVFNCDRPFYYRMKRNIPQNTKVSIIIPFKNQLAYLQKCIESLLSKTAYQDYDIILIDNGSSEDSKQHICEIVKWDNRISAFDYDIPFNYSKINNFGVTIAKGQHVLLMNSDIELFEEEWLSALLEHSIREEVGAVGGKLCYPDKTIQHAGIVIGIQGFAGHPYRGYPKESNGYYNRLRCIQNVSAVTGALMMVEKRLYLRVGGLDEVNLKISMNDVDFCLKLLSIGKYNVFTPYCEAIHHESASRGYETGKLKEARFYQEIRYFQKKWKKLVEKGDPYYHPKFTLKGEDMRYEEND